MIFLPSPNRTTYSIESAQRKPAKKVASPYSGCYTVSTSFYKETMSIPTRKPINYLNNKDILKEIHESKSSYCCFTKKEYHRYDLIINKPDQPLEKSLESCLSPKIIREAKAVRAARLTATTGKKVEPKSIPVTDLVFRVMTWDHIPVSAKQPRKTTKKQKAQEFFDFEGEDSDEDLFKDLDDVEDEQSDEVDDMVHVKVNFPPFQHFKIDEKNTVYCVGKSHWTGGVKGGHFSKDHGKITDKLARMYIMLCEKYAMKYNWRGYTYNDEMRNSAILQLTYVGLRFNEAKSSNPFSYYTAAISNSFCRVQNSEKRNQNIRDDILQINNLNPSWSRQGSSSSTVYEE